MYEKHTTLKSVVAHYVTDDHTVLWKTKIYCCRVGDIQLRGTLLRRLQRLYYNLRWWRERCSDGLENQHQDT